MNSTDKRNKKQLRYDNAYMEMAEAFSKLSYAERHKVGCVIVSPKGQIISEHYQVVIILVNTQMNMVNL